MKTNLQWKKQFWALVSHPAFNCPKTTMNSPEQCAKSFQGYYNDVVNFKQISHIALMFPLLLWTGKCHPEFVQNTRQGISVRVTQFLVNSLFYIRNFIKSGFLRICIKSAGRKHIFCLSQNKLFHHDIDLTYSLFASFAANTFIWLSLMIKSIFYQLPN